MAMAITTLATNNKNRRDVRNYKTELGLTQEQMTQINSIYTNFNARIKLQAPAENSVVKMQNYATLIKERQKEIRKVLTPEQKQTLSKLRKAELEKKPMKIKQ